MSILSYYKYQSTALVGSTRTKAMWLLFVFDLFMLSTAVAGESSATTCHQHGDCIKGWFGPTCQKQNVALKRPATQTSVYYERHQTSRPLNLTADYAVDGIVSNHLRNSPCSHTDGGDNTPSWTVSLNTSRHDKIYHMKVYLRNKHTHRNDGMEILVDDQTCYDWPPTERPDYVTDITCRQPLSGSTVTIRTPQEHLTLCEVQIFVCSDGWFGENCDKQCHCLDIKEVCDKITGHCSSGCSPGYRGKKCQALCNDGWFGENCDKECHCLDNKEICNRVTGHCFSGCTAGFTGGNCQEVCSDGWFGENCDKQCHCLDIKEVCDKITGHCSSGCSPGYRGKKCQALCNDGWFGDNCEKACHCLDNKEICDKVTGHCFSGCTAGFTGENCQASSAVSTDQGASWSITLTVAISCGAVILIIVLVASLWIRRLKMKIKALETTREEPYASLDQATMEQMSETCYTEIRVAEGRCDAIYVNSPVR